MTGWIVGGLIYLVVATCLTILFTSGGRKTKVDLRPQQVRRLPVREPIAKRR